MILRNKEGEILSIGQYNIIKTLAHSGFSRVFLVKDIRDSNKLYALKAIENPNNHYRIDNELKILKKVLHLPNIIQLKKAFKLSKNWFFLFEYANKNSLSYKIKENGKLTNKEIFKVLKIMLAVLKEVHALNIIHNDIKPENILIKDGDYYLCDWGISIDEKKTNTIHISTDKAYIAPEVFKGKFDIRSDIYSLGSTLYYLATAKKVYEIDNESSKSYIMYAHCFLSPDLSLVKSKKLKYIISQMLEKDPDKRISLKQLENLLQLNEKIEYIEEETFTNYEFYKNKDSFELYEELSKRDILFAKYSLAYLYEFNKDKRNIRKALVLYERAAKEGLAKAMCAYAMCYFNNLEIGKDEKKAYYWFSQAAKKNYEKAYYYLGYFYERGIVAKKDTKKAKELYQLSAYLGYRKSFDKLRRLNKNLKETT